MNVGSTTHAQLIIEWFDRSQGKNQSSFNIFDQFISLWFSFNAWMSFTTNKTVDREMLNDSKEDETLVLLHERLIKQQNYKDWVAKLAAFKIKDETSTRPDIQISNMNNWGDVLEAVYRVRCNLFHGKKSLGVPHDRELVELSFLVLGAIFGEVLKALKR